MSNERFIDPKIMIGFVESKINIVSMSKKGKICEILFMKSII